MFPLPTLEEYDAARLADKRNYGSTADKLYKLAEQWKQGLMTCEEYIAYTTFMIFDKKGK